MKTESTPSAGIFKSTLGVVLVLVTFWLPASLLAEPVPLKRMVDLALKHATGTAIASAEEQRVTAGYHELRNNYIPQMNIGAGIGYSDGFPLSLEGAAPSLINVTAQSALLNPALTEFIHASRSDVASSALTVKDQRNQVIQDTVLSYAELAKWERRISNLRETQSAAEQTLTAVQERVKEGIDRELDGDQARLSMYRVRLRITEATGSAEVLRERLSKLTGLPVSSIETDPDSVPALPAPQEDEPADKLAENNPSVQSAVEHARAQFLRYKGERRGLWPSVDFASQYANLASFNNYEQYYPHGFQPNNLTIGVAIHLPFLNIAQRAKIEEASADALKASKQAEQARNKVSEETLRLQRSVRQLQAARDVAELEYEIAQKNLAAVRTRMESSTANLHDLESARTQASERFISLEDIGFQLETSQIELLRSSGGLESWALGTK